MSIVKTYELPDDIQGKPLKLECGVTLTFTDKSNEDYLKNMSNETFAKWAALLHGLDIINDLCQDDDACIRIKMNALRDYLNLRSNDVMKLLWGNYS